MTGISDPCFREARRDRLTTLDGVLDILETAHENDLTFVTPALWSKLNPSFPAATVGQSIFDVIEQVFDAQEPYMVTIPIEAPVRRHPVSLVMPIGLDGRHEPNTTFPIIYRSSPARYQVAA